MQEILVLLAHHARSHLMSSVEHMVCGPSRSSKGLACTREALVSHLLVVAAAESMAERETRLEQMEAALMSSRGDGSPTRTQARPSYPMCPPPLTSHREGADRNSRCSCSAVSDKAGLVGALSRAFRTQLDFLRCRLAPRTCAHGAAESFCISSVWSGCLAARRVTGVQSIILRFMLGVSEEQMWPKLATRSCAIDHHGRYIGWRCLEG